jgi:hypothetical protein
MKLNNIFRSTKLDLMKREGETRVVEKFLLFPRAFGGHKMRWLEKARIKNNRR